MALIVSAMLISVHDPDAELGFHRERRRLNPGERATSHSANPGQRRPIPGAAASRPAIAVMTCTGRTVRR
jgi:hypothetical protein